MWKRDGRRTRLAEAQDAGVVKLAIRDTCSVRDSPQPPRHHPLPLLSVLFPRNGTHHPTASPRIINSDTPPRVHPRHSEIEAGRRDKSFAGIFTERGPYLQVNRDFHDTILTSPLIQLKTYLFAAGLEHNATSGIDLAQSREAFLQYSTGLNSLRPIEKRVVDKVPVDVHSWLFLAENNRLRLCDLRKFG
jgi:hypothetical protein